MQRVKPADFDLARNLRMSFAGGIIQLSTKNIADRVALECAADASRKPMHVLQAAIAIVWRNKAERSRHLMHARPRENPAGRTGLAGAFSVSLELAKLPTSLQKLPTNRSGRQHRWPAPRNLPATCSRCFKLVDGLCGALALRRPLADQLPRNVGPAIKRPAGRRVGQVLVGTQTEHKIRIATAFEFAAPLCFERRLLLLA